MYQKALDGVITDMIEINGPKYERYDSFEEKPGTLVLLLFFVELHSTVFFKNPTLTPNGFYWGHQGSRTLTRANTKQVSIEQSKYYNSK